MHTPHIKFSTTSSFWSRNMFLGILDGHDNYANSNFWPNQKKSIFHDFRARFRLSLPNHNLILPFLPVSNVTTSDCCWKLNHHAFMSGPDDSTCVSSRDYPWIISFERFVILANINLGLMTSTHHNSCENIENKPQNTSNFWGRLLL